MEASTPPGLLCLFPRMGARSLRNSYFTKPPAARVTEHNERREMEVNIAIEGMYEQVNERTG